MAENASVPAQYSTRRHAVLRFMPARPHMALTTTRRGLPTGSSGLPAFLLLRLLTSRLGIHSRDKPEPITHGPGLWTRAVTTSLPPITFPHHLSGQFLPVSFSPPTAGIAVGNAGSGSPYRWRRRNRAWDRDGYLLAALRLATSVWRHLLPDWPFHCSSAPHHPTLPRLRTPHRPLPANLPLPHFLTTHYAKDGPATFRHCGTRTFVRHWQWLRPSTLSTYRYQLPKGQGFCLSHAYHYRQRTGAGDAADLSLAIRPPDTAPHRSATQPPPWFGGFHLNNMTPHRHADAPLERPAASPPRNLPIVLHLDSSFSPPSPRLLPSTPRCQAPHSSAFVAAAGGTRRAHRLQDRTA